MKRQGTTMSDHPSSSTPALSSFTLSSQTQQHRISQQRQTAPPTSSRYPLRLSATSNHPSSTISTLRAPVFGFNSVTLSSQTEQHRISHRLPARTATSATPSEEQGSSVVQPLWTRPKPPIYEVRFPGLYLTLGEARERGLGTQLNYSDKFSTIATIMSVDRECFSYQMCPTPHCRKKVTCNGDGTFYCSKCRSNFPVHHHGMMINMVLGDGTDLRQVVMFSTPGESLLQQTAKKLHFYKSIAPDMLQDVFNLTKLKKLQFLLETSTVLFEDAPMLTTKVKEWMTVNVIDNNLRLLQNIKKLRS